MNWNVLFSGVALGWIACYLLHRWLKVSELRQGQAEMLKAIAVLEKEIVRLTELNKDLMDRLFQSKAMAPSGVDLTEAYEERKQKDREHKERTQGKRVPPGPLERLTEKWKEKDLKAADQGIDLTSGKYNAN